MQPSKFTAIDVVDQAFRKSMALYIGDNGQYYCLSVIKEDIFIFLFIRSIGSLKRVVFEICQNNGQANFIRGPMALNFLPNKNENMRRIVHPRNFPHVLCLSLVMYFKRTFGTCENISFDKHFRKRTISLFFSFWTSPEKSSNDTTRSFRTRIESIQPLFILDSTPSETCFDNPSTSIEKVGSTKVYQSMTAGNYDRLSLFFLPFLLLSGALFVSLGHK